MYGVCSAENMALTRTLAETGTDDLTSKLLLLLLLLLPLLYYLTLRRLMSYIYIYSFISIQPLGRF